MVSPLKTSVTNSRVQPAPILHSSRVPAPQVSRDNIRHWRTPSAGRLVTSTGNLRMTVRQHHFKSGVMQLKCIASLGDVYWESVHVDLPLWGQPVRGARSNGLFANGG